MANWRMTFNRERAEKTLQRAMAYVRTHPLESAVGGVIALAVCVLLVFVVVSIRRARGTEVIAPQAIDETQHCARLRALAGDKPKASPALLKKLGEFAHDVIGSDGRADDALAMLTVANVCAQRKLTNSDFVWQAHVETTLSRGEWPAAAGAPPVDESVRASVAAAINQPSRLVFSPPPAEELKQAWLRLALETSDLPHAIRSVTAVRAAATNGKKTAIKIEKLLAPFYSEESTTEALAWLYTQAQNLPEQNGYADFRAELFKQFGLMTEPIWVSDLAAPSPAAVPSNAIRGPEGALSFYGVLDDSHCALALAGHKLWFRSCAGLVPRRLPAGELFLVSTATDSTTPQTQYAAVLVGDDGAVSWSGAAGSAAPARDIQATTSRAAIVGFVAAAPKYALDAKSGKPHTLTIALQPHPENSTFSATGAAPAVVWFAASSPLKFPKTCAKNLLPARGADAQTCASLTIGAAGARCQLGVPRCVELSSGAQLMAQPWHLALGADCAESDKSRCPAAHRRGLVMRVHAGAQWQDPEIVVVPPAPEIP